MLDYGDIGLKVRDATGSQKGARFKKIVDKKCKEEIKFGNVDSENPSMWMKWSGWVRNRFKMLNGRTESGLQSKITIVCFISYLQDSL